MISAATLKQLARKHGTPLLVVDHDALRKNYAAFRKHLPRVQAYYALKANADREVVRTLFDCGASFLVASMPEFMVVHQYIRDLPERERQQWIWDKIIYGHPIKANETLRQLHRYKPLLAYDNREEIRKIKKHAPHAGVALRLKVPSTGAMVELSSKFGAAPGEAVDLILEADRAGLTVEGLSFHVGSQTTNLENYVQALNLAANVFEEARGRGYGKMNLLDLGGGFPAPCGDSVTAFRDLAKVLNRELDRLFDEDVQILAEPGRFLVASAGTAVCSIVGKAERDGKLCYYVDDGVYQTFSGVVFEHGHYHLQAFKQGPREVCSVFGPTCDALDVVSMSESLPSTLGLGDLLYAKDMGAYSHASATHFNGFSPAKVVHVHR
jgi:ornithine decarboxylase